VFSTRDRTIDTLRGLAVFTMVAANGGAEVLAEPHPLWFRFYGSFAAPLFILISGMMVALTRQTKGHRLKYFVVRGMMIIIVGALEDVLIWRIYPFMTVDVLYLIGISLPLAYLFLHLAGLSRWIIVLSLFAVTPVLQKILGYTDYPTEIDLWGEQTVMVVNQTNVFNHWVVDGWFPIFPWAGFSLLGVNLAHLRWKSQPCTPSGRGSTLLIGMSTLVLGGLIWGFYPGRLLIREGYSELFYPPTIGYVMSSVGLIIVLFSIVDWRPSVVIYEPLLALGESALFMYIGHLAFIVYVIVPLWPEEDFQTFLVTYFTLSFFLILMGFGLRTLKTRWKDRPFVMRVLFGS